MKKRKKITSFVLALSLSLSLWGCQSKPQNNTPTTGATVAEQTTRAEEPTRETKEYTEDDLQKQAAFDRFLDEFFRDTISQSDTISVHYLMQRPEDFGITDYPITFGKLIKDEKEAEKELTDFLAELQKFDKATLTVDQQITYSVMEYYFNASLALVPFTYYDEPLPVSSGMHAMMPVYFAEYDLMREQDVKDYLALLSQVKPYFEEIIAFEKKRIELGIFMDDHALDEVISQCRMVLNDALDHFYLNEIFAAHIAEVPGLDQNQKDAYVKEHEQLIQEAFAPAYQWLINELSGLKGQGGKVQGASTYPKGEEYIELLSRYKIASTRSVGELKAALEAENTKLLTQIQTLITLNPSLGADVMTFQQPSTDPEGILVHLIDYFKDLFPGLNDCTYTVNYVHKSLEPSVSPAFYMIPPIDGYKQNSIYINNGRIEGNGLFTTLAHEGYPGHLLQNTYFRSVGTHPARALFSFLSYSEGWASYVEHSAYAAIDGVSGSLAKVLAANGQFSLNMLALADLGVNYEGWSLDKTCDFLQINFGIEDRKQMEEFYYIFASTPLSYLPYAVGELELSELIRAEQEAKEDKFDFYTFHKAFLTVGPAPLSIVKEYLYR